jgi:ABC-type uncharacterized transport system permease subunit
MSLRSVATAFGLVGGLCWVVRAFADHEVLEWAGFILIGIAAAAVGATLVNSSALPLRLFVAVAFPLLVWSVLELLRDANPDRTVDAVFGAAAVVTAVVAFTRRPVRGQHSGSHSRSHAGNH